MKCHKFKDIKIYFNNEIIEIINKIIVKKINRMLIVNHKINSKITKLNYIISILFNFFNLNQNNLLTINNLNLFINRMFTIINSTIIKIVNTLKIVYLQYYFDYKSMFSQIR